MKRFFRKFLGLDQDAKDILGAIAVLREDLAVMRSDFTMTIGADEFDPRRKAASDKISQLAINRMLADEKVLRYYNLKPDKDS